MPPKKAVKQPVRQLARDRNQPSRRRPGGAATVDRAAGPPAADTIPLTDASAPRAMPAAPAQPAPARQVPQARRPLAAPAAGSSLRALRGRVAQQIQTMDLHEEMAWIRSDIGRLAVLAA